MFKIQAYILLANEKKNYLQTSEKNKRNCTETRGDQKKHFCNSRRPREVFAIPYKKVLYSQTKGVKHKYIYCVFRD